MQEKLRIANKVLYRLLVISIIVVLGSAYQIYATDILGINEGVTISGNLYVTSSLTVGGNEGETASGALIFWDGASCPSGWTDVSSSYANRFPLGGSSLLNSGADTHTHTAYHTHGQSYSLGTLSHSHSYSASDSSESHSHVTNSCGAVGDNTYIGRLYHEAGGSTGSASHSHGGWSGTTGVESSHSHSVSGSTGGPSIGSSTSDTHIPLYRTLKLCKKA